MYTDIFIVRRNCVFPNFQIFPFLEKAIFSLFSSRKYAHFFVLVTQKRYRSVTLSDYENVRKSSKIYRLSVYFHVFTPCEKMWFCAVLLVLVYSNFINEERAIANVHTCGCSKTYTLFVVKLQNGCCRRLVVGSVFSSQTELH